jgi:pSer/pThr/pTyr-binding forkhead associated (FHA) protein
MTPTIEILTGELMGRAYDVDEAPFTIGRKEDCAIVIPKKYFSRRHAEVVEKSGRWFVRGLSEKNPVRVGKAEVEEQELSNGTEFEICGVRFRFRTSGAKGATKRDREELRNSGQQAALAAVGGGGTPTVAYKRSTVTGKGRADNGSQRSADVQDIEDGPLPGASDEESATEQLDKGSGFGKGSRSGSQKSGAGATFSSASGGDGRPGWRQAPDEGPRDRVVFDDDEPAKPSSSKKSGSGEDKEERTDQIDVSKLRKDNDDPFAEGPTKEEVKANETSEAREKFLKLLVLAGTLGILLAGGMVWYYNRPREARTFQVPLKPQCGVGDVRRYEFILNDNDPPAVGGRSTPANGDPTNLIQADDTSIATVEWAVPEAPVAYFLVTGVSPGTTSFRIPFQSGDSRIFQIEISGPSHHDVLRKARKDKHAQLTVDDLRVQIKDRLRVADELKGIAERNPNPEKFPRRIYHQCEIAAELLSAYEKKINESGVADPDFDTMRLDVQAHVDDSRRVWLEMVGTKKQSYDDLVRTNRWKDAATELQTLCWAKGDTCDAEPQRYILILEKIYGPKGFASFKNGTFDGPGCIEEAP